MNVININIYNPRKASSHYINIIQTNQIGLDIAILSLNDVAAI